MGGRKRKRHALGQHFLKDPGTIKKIVDAFLSELQVHPCRTLLEIGPGKGALTFPLLERLKEAQIESFWISEKDRDFAKFWNEQSNSQAVHILEGDFLDQDLSTWSVSFPLAVVSNLPYSAGTAMVVRLTECLLEIPFMILMFQKEVAERLRARPSHKEFGSLSLFIQNVWDVERLTLVRPDAFSPPPQVESEVVVLRKREIRQIPSTAGRDELWSKFLRTAFVHRRKMLRGNFKESRFKQALERSGVDGTRRAESLQWSEWQALWSAFISD